MNSPASGVIRSSSNRPSRRSTQQTAQPLRHAPRVTALAVSLLMWGPGVLHAAPASSNEELQAEVARLKAEVAALKAGAQPATAASEPAAAATGSAPVDTKPAAPAEPAKAESIQELDKVVVRSSNRSKLARVADVPQSISVIGGKDLESQLALDIGAVSQRSAGLVRNVGNSRTFSLSIRGVGKVTQTEAQDVSVGLNADGVPIAYAPFASFDFYDVDTVEVARGAQGTLQGKNFTMGTVSINTRNPSFIPDASWSIALGQHATVISQVAGGGPVLDDVLAWRGALTVQKGNGPYTNIYNSDNSYFNKDRVSGRVKLLFTPTPDFSALASVEIQPNGAEFYNSGTVKTIVPARYSNNGVSTVDTTVDVAGKLSRDWFTNQIGGQNFFYSGLYLNNPNPDVNNQQPLYTYTNNASLLLKQSLDTVDLTSITAMRRYHFGASNDEGTPFTISLNGGGKVDQYKQVSQEFRVSSKPGGTVDWQTGLFLWRNQVDYGQDSLSSGWGSDAGAYFANNTQYGVLNQDAAGRQLMSESVNGMGKSSAQLIVNKSAAVFGQADWHLSDLFTITTGGRITREERTNDTSSLIVNNGLGGALNPVFLKNSVGTVQLGGFDSVAATIKNGVFTNAPTAGNLNPGNTPAQQALADQVAQRYFGVASYSLLSQPQRNQIAMAKSLRQTQIGTVWNPISGPSFRKTFPGVNISPSYKINPDQTAYVSAQYGVKGGVSQVINGVPVLAAPEKATSLELGLKSSLLDKSLILNADVFHSIIHNYQQTVSTPDPLNSSATINYVGNAPKVSIDGLEIDSTYSGLSHVTARLSGAYTLARYKSFPNSPLPAEDQIVGTNTSQDVSGQILPGASRVNVNIGAEYRLPVWGEKQFHTSFNSAYVSRYNSDANLSDFAWIPSHWTTDANIGLGRADQKFDVSLIVKNLFNDKTPQSQTWNTYVPALPRWIGIQFSGKL